MAPQVAPETLTQAWIAMEKHIEGGNQWAKVVGPMSGTYMHLKKIGWQLETNEVGHINCIIDHNNETWRPNDAVTWADFQEEIESVRIKNLWQQASEHRGGASMTQGVDLSVAQRHYKGLVCAGKHREAAYAQEHVGRLKDFSKI